MTAKQIRFVKADKANTEQHIAEVALFDEDGTPLDPPASGGGSAAIADSSVTTAKLADGAVNSRKIQDGSITGSDLANNAVTADKIASGVLPTNATKENAGLVKQAAHVDGTSGTVQQIVDSLVAAGIMAAS